jgi:hypothetical protein
MTISTTRRVLAVVAMTTALCADQAAIAAPAARPHGTEIAQIASRLVSRLAQNFRRVMPAAFSAPARQHCFADLVAPAFSHASPRSPAHAPLSPFQFRLPPPVL